MEDTIIFRIDVERKKIEDFISKKEEILAKKNNLSKNQEENSSRSKLIINIRQALNLEPEIEGNDFYFVINIVYEGQHFKTEPVKNNFNPQWDEEFTMYIK